MHELTIESFEGQDVLIFTEEMIAHLNAKIGDTLIISQKGDAYFLSRRD